MPRTEMRFDTVVNDRQLADFNRKLAEYEENAHGSAAASGALDKSFGSLAIRIGQLVAAYATFSTVVSAIKTAENFQQALIGVEKTTGMAGDELAKLSSEIFKMGAIIKGVETDELLAIAQTAGQLGIKGVKDISSFTETIAKVGVATDLTTEQAATSFATLSNILGVTTDEMGRMGSVFNEVSNNSTALVSDLVEFTLRIAGAGKTIGLTYDEIIGLSGALKDTGNNFEVGGSAISRALQLMISDTDKFAEVSGKSLEEFSSILNNKPIEAVKLFINQLSSLDKVARLQALEKVGLTGIEASGTFLKLSEGVASLEKNLKTANDEFARGTSLQKEYEAASRSSIASTDRLSNVLDGLSNTIAAPFLSIKTEATDSAAVMVLTFDEGFKQLYLRAEDFYTRFQRLSKGTQLEFAKSFQASVGVDLKGGLQSLADSLNEITGSNAGTVLAGLVGSKLPEFMLDSAEDTKELQKEVDGLSEKIAEIGEKSATSKKEYEELLEAIRNGESVQPQQAGAPQQEKIAPDAEAAAKATGDWSRALKVGEAAALGVSKAIRTAEKDALLLDKAFSEALKKESETNQFAENVGNAVEMALISAIVDGLNGDFDPAGIIKGLSETLLIFGLQMTLTTSEAVRNGIIAGMSGGAGIAAIGAAGILGANAFGGGGDNGPSPEEKWLERQANILEQIRDNTDKLNEFDLTGTALQTGLSSLGDNVARRLITEIDPDTYSGGTRYEDISIADLLAMTAEQRAGGEIPTEGYTDITASAVELFGDEYISEAGSALSTFQDVIYGIGQASGDTSLQLQNAKNALIAAGIGFNGTEESYDDITAKVKSYNSTLFDLDQRMKAAVKAGDELEQLKIADEIEGFTEANSGLLTGILDNYDAFKLLGDEFSSLTDDVDNLTDHFKGMAASLTGVIIQQQQFIDTSTEQTMGGTKYLDYLQDRLKTEDEQADKARAAVIAAGGDVTAEQIATLAKEEQDLLGIANIIAQKTPEILGSSAEATQIIQNTQDTISTNLAQTVTIEQAMLDAAFETNDILRDIKTALDNLPFATADELSRLKDYVA